MTYPKNRVDDREILRIFEVARRHGALVCVHAENHDAIMYMTQRLLDAGLGHNKYHAWCKPALVEREATTRIIMLAELRGQPTQILHVTSEEAGEEHGRASCRANGIRYV